MIDIRLLGSITILVNDVPLEGDAAQRRRLALLALLATPPLQPHSRDWLMGMLWPENDTDSARHLLSASIHVLRKALGAEAIVAASDTIAINASAVSIDCLKFRTALDEGRTADAIALYGGPFMDGFFAKSSAELEHWIDGERAEYSRLYRDALKQAGAWRALSALDPLDVHATLGLMRQMAEEGDRAGALRQAQVHAYRLEQELGAMPDPAVEQLAAEIRSKGGLRVAPTASVEAEAASVEPGEASGKATAQSRQYAPAQASAVEERSRMRRGSLPLLAGGAILLFSAALWFLRPGNPTAHSADPAIDHTIVVMPFKNGSTDTLAAQLADGVPEQIIDLLARYDSINVVPVTSAAQVAKTSMVPSDIGQRLHAGYMVDGSLQKFGNRLRILVRLVRTADNQLAWHDTYNRQLGNDIFAVEDEIAANVVEKMAVTLGAAPTNRSRTANADAWTLYTSGTAEMARRTPASLMLARDRFQRAVALDSTYALAWASLANTYALLGSYDYGALQPREAFPQAVKAARRALDLDPGLDMAYAALGNAYVNYDWDFAAAERAFRDALSINPRNPVARQWYALLLVAQQRNREALTQVDSALLIDPLSPMAYVNQAHVLYYSHDYTGAAASLDKALSLDPAFNRAHLLYALVDMQRGRAQQAAQRLMQASEAEPAVTAMLVCALAKSGKLAEAQLYAARLDAQAKAGKYVANELGAAAAIALKQNDRAFDFLQQALRLRSGGLTYLKVEPLVDPIRSDPRFAALAGMIKPMAAD